MKLSGAFIDDGRLRNSDNNFDIIRIVAAYMVIFSHSWTLYGQNPLGDPFFQLVGISGGEVAVTLFFVVSGFLIYRAAERSRDIFSYFLSRILRLYPAALICALLLALVAGPLFTVLPLAEYFGQSRTWSFIVRNTLLVAVQYDLPGVFLDNHYPVAVNGSLWSLKIEIKLYFVIAILVFLLRASRAPKKVWNAVAVFAVVVFLTILYVDNPIYYAPENSKSYLMYHFGYYFMAGSVLYAFRHRIPVSLPLLAVIAGAYALSVHTDYSDITARLFYPYLVYYIAFARLPIPGAVRRTPDISYGVYIYGFPSQQMVAALLYGVAPFYACMALSMAMATGMALLSWRFIERPALTNKCGIDDWLRGKAPRLLQNKHARSWGKRLKDRFPGSARHRDDPESGRSLGE